MGFTLWLDEICAQPARAVLEAIQQAEKKPLGDLRIYDLLRDGDRPLVNGVYFFFSAEGRCLYVGKNSAQKFVERIPIHLSIAESSWMNYFLKRIKKFEHLPSLIEAAEAACSHTLLLMPVASKDQVGAVEKFFRLFAAPKYNSPSARSLGRYQHLDLGAPLTELLKYM